MKLELDLNEVNAILTALGSQPYAQVFNLVTKIQQQAQEQLKPETPDEL
jgi:hypothetical protein